jgi:phage FluMu gp28-like protein
VTQLVYHRPKLAAYQERAIFDPARYSVIEATTKAGKTVACIVWLTEKAMGGKEGQAFWWVAPVYKQARIAFDRLKRSLRETGIRGLFVANESELTITLANGAVLWFKSAEKPDNLYAEDVYAVVLDEFTRMREEAWYAIRSVITATRGQVRFIGNVKGRRNWGYRLARKAEAGEQDMAYHCITAADAVAAGILEQEEIDGAERELPHAVFRELYFAEASDDGSNPFGMEAIHACIAPLASTKPARWGWDLAKSVDWTVGIALDKQGRACRFERFQADWDTTTRRICELTGKTPARVDSTGVGDPIVELLQRQLGPNVEGYKFTLQSKQQLMEALAVAIQQRRISFPEGPIVAELEAFEYEYTRQGVRYTAPEGMHDDCVTALGLANGGAEPAREWGTLAGAGDVERDRADVPIFGRIPQ